jgi:hypothetical protein
VPELSPKIASELAEEIYDILDETLAKKFLMRPEFSNKTSKQTLVADLGFNFIKTQSAFGLCTMGGKSYERDLFIIFRGSTKMRADWMTNASIGLQTSTSGWPVHKGFNSAFKSMRLQIQTFLSKIDSSITIHCIGHSLGGAVATIAAHWISRNTNNSVKLYTFGAPKPGLMMYANSVTRELRADNIFRVYHATDPVPMIPLYPYVHPPFPGFGHYIDSNESIFSAGAHDIAKYVQNVSEIDWNELKRRKPLFSAESGIKHWLESNIPVHAGTPRIWEWLNSALIYVLTKLTSAFVGTLQACLIGAFTITDTLAMILQKGIELGKSLKLPELSRWVFLLMNKIMQALGMGVADESFEFTQTFIRNILFRLNQRLNDEARKALFAA